MTRSLLSRSRLRRLGRGARRAPLLGLGLLPAIMVLLYAVAGPAADALVVHLHPASSGGSGLGWLTGHFVHSDASHLGWNVAGLSVLSVYCSRWLGAARTMATLLMGIACVNAWLVVFEPSVARYCGLSGALNALLSAGCLAAWQGGQRIAGLVLAIATVKVGVEMAIGDALLTNTAWPSLPGAHAAGLAAGALATAAFKVRVPILTTPPASYTE